MGIPICGAVIEDAGTPYHEYLEIWYTRDEIYRINIVGLNQYNNTITSSENTHAIIWYIENKI